VYVRYALSSQTTAQVNFVEPTYKGKSGVARYRVKSNTNVTTLGDTPPIEVTGLSPGNNYNFTVTTIADYGAESDESAVSNTFQLGTAPGAPTIGTATAGTTTATANSASVTFTPGTAGTGTTTYTATSVPGGLTASNTTGATLVVTGLTAGTSYTFTVSAANAYGSNTSGQSNSITAYGASSAPVLNSVSAEYSRASLSWTAPSTGYPTSYTYTAYAVASGYPTRSATTSGTSVTISNLSNYVTYTFYVRATNDIGISGNSNSLTEYTDVPCPGGTVIGTAVYAGGNGATCTYNRICDGDGGIGLAYASGGCSVYCPQGAAYGPYCPGCTPLCCENQC
jgi:trimeric autotransporter adhesin